MECTSRHHVLPCKEDTFIFFLVIQNLWVQIQTRLTLFAVLTNRLHYLHWEKWTDEQRTPQHLTLGNVVTKFLICNFTRDAIYRLKDVIVSFGWQDWRHSHLCSPHRISEIGPYVRDEPEALEKSKPLGGLSALHSHAHIKQSEFGWSVTESFNICFCHHFTFEHCYHSKVYCPRIESKWHHGWRFCARCAATQKPKGHAGRWLCPAGLRLSLPAVPSWLPAGESLSYSQ